MIVCLYNNKRTCQIKTFHFILHIVALKDIATNQQNITSIRYLRMSGKRCKVIIV